MHTPYRTYISCKFGGRDNPGVGIGIQKKAVDPWTSSPLSLWAGGSCHVHDPTRTLQKHVMDVSVFGRVFVQVHLHVDRMDLGLGCLCQCQDECRIAQCQKFSKCNFNRFPCEQPLQDMPILYLSSFNEHDLSRLSPIVSPS
jgi:hypothetical protein